MLTLEIIGWIGTILQVIGGIYLAITQKSTFFLWFVWTIGAPCVIFPLLFYGDLKNSIVFIVFEGNNILGLIRWFRGREKSKLHSMTEEQFEGAILCKCICYTCGNDTFEYLSVGGITKCDTCGTPVDFKALKDTKHWQEIRKL
jgi:hypothetical protein